VTGRRDGFFGSRAAGNTCLAKALIAAGIPMAPSWSEGPLRSLLLKFPVGVLW
jgi:hypothetical protein